MIQILALQSLLLTTWCRLPRVYRVNSGYVIQQSETVDWGHRRTMRNTCLGIHTPMSIDGRMIVTIITRAAEQ
jgi:hypothetical protein